MKVTAYAVRLGALEMGAPEPIAQPGDQSQPGDTPQPERRQPSRPRRLPAGPGAGVRVGIRAGMPLAEALALHEFSLLHQAEADQPALHVAPHDALADQLALVDLAAACQRFSPTVGLEESERPESLLLDITGLAELFGGEAQLAARVAEWLTQRGLVARLAVADTLGAAWAAAHAAGRFALLPAGETAAHVADLPLAVLRLPAETLGLLGQLGLESIGQVDHLPRASLLARFGPECVRRLDQACGRLAEVIRAQHLPGELAADWVFEHPTERRDVLETVLGQLLPRVVEPLASQRRGVVELVCRLECQAEAPRHWSLRLFRPSAAVEHLLDMLRLRLESVWVRRPVTAVRLTVTAWGLLELTQQELFDGSALDGAALDESALDGAVFHGAAPRSTERELAALVDRLTSRLGRQAVLRAQLLADAQPEHACQYLPPDEVARSSGRAAVSSGRAARSSGRAARRPGSKRSGRSAKPAPSASVPALAPGQRPLELCLPPLELPVLAVVPDGPPLRFRLAGVEEQVARFWGPERIETGWWRSRCVRRDYYRVETVGGQWFWLFRRLDDARWFLQGTFE